MRFITYYDNQELKLGIVQNDLVIPAPMSPDEFYKRGLEALPELQAVSLQHEDVALNASGLQLAPVVPNPGKILCIGLNYRRHAAETGAKETAYPLLFSKFNNTLASHEEDVVYFALHIQLKTFAEFFVAFPRYDDNFITFLNAHESAL